jgi:hypothetical protein
MKVLSLAKSCMTALAVTLGIAIAAGGAGAQEVVKAAPFYDASREVTVQGAVSSVLTKPNAGMIFGSHLLLQTASGELDASLGRWALQGKGAVPLTAGQHVELTGVVKTLMKRQVLIVRTVSVNGQVYAIRNQHGVEVSSLARERAEQQATQNGGLQ